MDENTEKTGVEMLPVYVADGVVAVCDDCGRAIHEGETYIVDHEGRYVCEDCADNYEKCCECDKWFSSDDIYRHRSSDGGALCKACYDAGYSTCDDCCDVVPNEDTYETRGGRTICLECYDNNYFTCPRCDHICRWEDGEDVGNARYCDDCAREEREEDEEYSGVGGYHSFSRSKYKPRVCDGESPSGGVYMGVELEVDGGSFDKSDFAEWTDDNNLIHFEHDGSLSDDGVECITMPCSLQFHQERMRWGALCETFRRQDFLSNDADGGTCGLHVHVSRKPLTKSTLIKMDVWVNRWMLWRDVARRKTIYSGHYDDFKTWDDAAAEAVTDVPYHRLGSFYKKFAGKCPDRYVPLNFYTHNGGETVELRLFKGTLNAETILGTLEMIDAMVKFAPTTDIREVYSTLMPSLFLKWIAERKDTYRNVFPMLGRLAKRSHNHPKTMEVIDANK